MMPARFPALLRGECKRLLRSRATYAFAAMALILALATILSSPDEQNALLFMVAGDDPGRVGGAVGFIGNLVDADDVAGSAARTSLVFTMLWIPSVIIYAVVTTAQDYTSASYSVSKARGVSDAASVLSKLATRGAFCCLTYIAFNGMAFAFKLIQYGGPVSLAGIACFALPAALGAIVLASLLAEASALCLLMRSATAASVIAVAFSLFVMAWFPSTYVEGAGAGSPILYLSPVFYLMNVCALCFQTVGTSEVLLYAAAAIPVMCLVSVGALKLREVF